MQNAAELWAKWPAEFLEDEYAQKRIKSAKEKKLTPIKIDRDDCYGYFQGSHGRYETFLDSCPCGDFHRAKRPCKHMFRLAMELGVMEGDFKSDINSIVPLRKDQEPLSDTLDIVETFPETAQKQLLEIVKHVSREKPVYKVAPSDDISLLFGAGIIETVGDVNNGKVPIKCSEKIMRGELHKYLHRKYDSIDYTDDGESWVSIPLLETHLPDDIATKELIKRGYGDKIGTQNVTSTGEFFTAVKMF